MPLSDSPESHPASDGFGQALSSLLASGAIGILRLDAEQRVAGRHGALVESIDVGEAAAEVLPILVGYEDFLAELSAGRAAPLHLPCIAMAQAESAWHGALSIQAYPAADRQGVVLLLQDAEAAAQLDRQRLQQRNELALAQTALQRAREAAEAASRAKSAFLANVSHELRTPLHVIIGNAEILGEQNLQSLSREDLAAYVRDIQDSGTYLLDLVNDLLDLSKAEAGRMALVEETFELEVLLSESLEMAQAYPQAAARSLKLSVETDLPALHADRRRLKQVILNLLTNAIKFTAPDGHVVLEARRDGAAGLIVSVRDNGCGMPAETVAQVTEPFVQGAAAEGRGTGLGLHLVKTMVELHDGRLTIESAPDRGTLVALWLPGHRLQGGH